MNTKTNSKRLYHIAFAETDCISSQKYTLDDILDTSDCYEWKYAIAEILDKVLDLRIHESIVFNHNRDNTKSLGLILRIN